MSINQQWEETPTRLFLNGPTLSFTSEPSSITLDSGASGTFVGVATATFPADTDTTKFRVTLSLGQLQGPDTTAGFASWPSSERRGKPSFLQADRKGLCYLISKYASTGLSS